MSIFKDEVYENMDDISKLIEPFEYGVNNDLSQFPDEIEVTQELLTKCSPHYSSWMQAFSLTANFVLRLKAKELGLNKLDEELLTKSNFDREMFEMVLVKDDENVDITFDIVTGILTGGQIFIRKKNIAVEDKSIEEAMIAQIKSMFNRNFNCSNDVGKGRLNEIANLFGADKARKERKWQPKVKELEVFLMQYIKDKKIEIKDVELFKRFVNWIVLYIKNGNLPALANITRIKIMAQSGFPIYSMKEEQV